MAKYHLLGAVFQVTVVPQGSFHAHKHNDVTMTGSSLSELLQSKTDLNILKWSVIQTP